MAKKLTVFYSWQSDTPSNLNRSFIEQAIQEALNRLKSDAKLEAALRDATIELDKDTKNVPGSPPITDTILKKIEGCVVFIADLTFVGESLEGLHNAAGKPRLIPNPNVLIEYGYAVRCHTHAAMVGIMNIAYGKPDDHSLPFDLRHLLWPLTYQLGAAAASNIYSLDPNPGHVESESIEENFAKTLQNYMQFAQKKLQLPLPLQAELGLVGIKDYQILVDNRLHGKFPQDSIKWNVEITSYEKPAWEILDGFFKLLWNKFGMPRPPERQIELAQQFASSL